MSWFRMMKGDDAAGFYGPRSTSPNGKFTLAWFDGDLSSGRGGFRESGDGRYALLEGSRVVLRGRLQRPNDGHVANNGSFVLNDWMFGEGLKGTFYAFSKSGQILLSKVFRANLLNCGISSDGRYAVCQTCNCDNEDSHRLSLFDLVNAEMLFCVEPPSDRWAETYEIDFANQKVYMGCGDWGRFAFSFSGEFLDQDRWENEVIKRATGVQLGRIARDHWKRKETRANPERTGATLLLMQEALNRDMAKYPAEKARVHRDIGEVYESLGQNDKALEHFKISVSIDPSSGVKRAIDRLSSTLGTPLTAKCPYCLGSLPRAPTRKSKCPDCGKSIFVKNRPGSSEVLLVTENDAKKIDEEWEWSRKTSTWLRVLERYGLSDEEFQLRRKRNQQAYGSKANDRDIFWRFLNELLPKTLDEWKLSNVYNMIAMFLHEEHKDFFAPLQESKRWVLRALKAGGCLNVRISASKDACEACKRQDGKVLKIDEAIALLPVPCSECQSISLGAKGGFCRCRYVSLEGVVLVRGSVEIMAGSFPAVIG